MKETKQIRIGYDAKRAYHNSSGLGNYSRDLIRMVQDVCSHWELFLFNPKKKANFQVDVRQNTYEITPQSYFAKKLKSLWRTYKITSIAQKIGLDLYHGLSGEIPVGIHKKIPTVVTIHDLIFIRYPELYSTFDRKMHYKKFLYAAQNAHHIIAISEQTKEDIIRYLGVSEEKISVVYQGCHSAYKANYSKEEKEQVREKYQLPTQYILNVGTIEKRKNALSIVQAIRKIDTTLVLVGRKTTYYQEIEAYAKKHQIEHKIKVLSGVSTPELAMIYQMASIFCYPSIFEGFGIPIIEALFSKTPVITTQGSCFPEAAGPDSLYVRTENAPQELKQHIEFLLKHSEEASQIAQKGYAYAQRFIDEVVTQELLRVYDNLLKNHID